MPTNVCTVRLSSGNKNLTKTTVLYYWQKWRPYIAAIRSYDRRPRELISTNILYGFEEMFHWFNLRFLATVKSRTYSEWSRTEHQLRNQKFGLPCTLSECLEFKPVFYQTSTSWYHHRKSEAARRQQIKAEWILRRRPSLNILHTW